VRSPFSGRRLCAVVAALPSSQGHPQQQWKTWWPDIGESCWGKFTATLCRPLGGTLPSPLGRLLSHLACPALVINADCSYISIHFSLEIAESACHMLRAAKSAAIEMTPTNSHVQLCPRLERRLHACGAGLALQTAHHQVERDSSSSATRSADVAGGSAAGCVSVGYRGQGDRPADRAPDEATHRSRRDVLVNVCRAPSQ